MTELQKLDAFAQAETARRLPRRYMGWNIIPLIWLIDFHADWKQGLVYGALATLMLTANVFLWRGRRHALLFAAATMPILSAGFLWLSQWNTAGWFLCITGPLFCAVGSFILCRANERMSALPAKEWTEEERQFRKWTDRLENDEPSPDIVEYAGGGFWTGLYNLRVLTDRNYCVVYQFGRNGLVNWAAFSVLAAEDVRIVDAPNRPVSLEIGSRRYRDLDLLTARPVSI